MYIKGLLITVSRVFSCVQLSYIDPILLSHSYIFATSRDLNTTLICMALTRHSYIQLEGKGPDPVRDYEV